MVKIWTFSLDLERKLAAGLPLLSQSEVEAERCKGSMAVIFCITPYRYLFFLSDSDFINFCAYPVKKVLFLLHQIAGWFHF